MVRKVKVTKKDMENVAVLSRLSIPADKEELYTQQLSDVLEYVDNLSAVPTDDIQPMAHVLPVSNVFREDVVTNGDNHEAMLANAPQQKEQSYKVPRTFA